MIHRIKFNSKTFKIYSLKSKEIEEIFKNPRLLQKKFSIILPYFKVKLTVKVFVRDNEEFLIKYGIIASKKIGKAAKRNFLKRRIRQIFIEAFKKKLLSLKSNFHFKNKFCALLFTIKKLQNKS
ncbi:MAG: ribonuclease P protein component [bacterium]